MKDHWTEAEVLELPPGEHDYFERKGDRVLTGEWRHRLAKALSALANSGGGHLVLGVEDNGHLTGLEPRRGTTPMREWLEQVIPNLLDYPLQHFRVHEVERSSDSSLPENKTVIVIDVGDSPIAPHQARPDRVYYSREGGHSKPAPHFLLELLRNRLTAPLLTANVAGVAVRDVYLRGREPDRALVVVRVQLSIENEGRAAAYKWEVVLDGLPNIKPGMEGYFPGPSKIPQYTGSSAISLDSTILPSRSRRGWVEFGFELAPTSGRMDHEPSVHLALEGLIDDQFTIGVRTVTETSRGSVKLLQIGSQVRSLTREIIQKRQSGAKAL